MNTTTCPFPYTSTNCTETFAEVIETQYRIWQGLYGGFFGLFFLFASWQSIAIVHMNGLFPIDMQKLLLFLGNLGGLTLVIRAIDLYGWEDRVSIIVNGK